MSTPNGGQRLSLSWALHVHIKGPAPTSLTCPHQKVVKVPVVTPLVYPWPIKHETFNCPLVRPTSCLQIHKQEVTNNALPFADARIVLRDYILGSTRTHWLDATPRLNKLAQYVLYRRITLPTPASGQRLESTLPLPTRLVKEQKKLKISNLK